MRVNLERFKQKCSCGKDHPIEVEAIWIEKGAINQIGSFIKKNSMQANVVLIGDTNTACYVEQVRCASLEGIKTYDIILEARDLHADEKGVERLRQKIEGGTSVLIAIGSGTVHDLTRFVAQEEGIPFISVPTAASVDGFVSTVCAMTWEGFKKTMLGVSPRAVFADTAIFATAPKRLTAAGVADLLGKYTALLDWRIAHLLTDEYLCEEIVTIEKEAIDEVVRSLDGLNKGEEKAYEKLMYGLILSGIAMQMVGNSRPASGAEHHMAHFWEMHVLNAPIDALHGEKVGVGLVLGSERYKEVVSDGTLRIKKYGGIPKGQIISIFGTVGPAILQENAKDCLSDVREERLKEQWAQIKELVEELPTPEGLRALLSKIGAKADVKEIGLDASIIEKSLQLSPYVRGRLTFMRIIQNLNK